MAIEPEEIKEFYNHQMPQKFGEDYEYTRWFKTKLLKEGYRSTKATIEKRFLSINMNVQKYIELGQGPGTWTKLFLEKYSAINLTLVDISNQMLLLAKEKLNNYKNKINFAESNFLDFETEDKFDTFFSSRVIEYIEDKEVAVKKINSILLPNSFGCIITKTPKYFLNKFLMRKTKQFHSGQISAKKLRKIFEENDMEIVGTYPTTFSFPLFKSYILNKILFYLFSPFQLNFLSNLFSESYMIIFKTT
jgi:ubiquinone/menaquinone biosynthesis C-methylase UbiE